MTARIAPAEPPFGAANQAWIDRTMKGRPALRLFTTLARDPRLCEKFFAAGLLDRGHLTLRQREIVIHRTTALCGSAYEFGVHALAFGERVGFDATQLHALAHEGSLHAGWTGTERHLLQLCESLHADCDIDDALWERLRGDFAEEAMLELLMLAGFYRTVSYLTNALRLPEEAGTRGFPPRARPAARASSEASRTNRPNRS